MNVHTASLFIFLFLFINPLIGQNNEIDKIDLYSFGLLKWDSLSSLEPEIIIEFYWGNHGGEIKLKGDKPCYCSGRNMFKFYFWKLKEQCFMQKIDCCRAHEIINLKDDKVFDALLKNQSALEKETFDTSVIWITDFIQIKYKIGEDEAIKCFYYSMINKSIEPDNWKNNKKTKSYRFLKWLYKYCKRWQ